MRCFTILLSLLFYGLGLWAQSPQAPNFKPIGSNSKANSSTGVGLKLPNTVAQNEQQRGMNMQNILDEDRQQKKAVANVQYELPSHSKETDAVFYQNAFDSITLMLENKKPLNLKKAIALVEKSYYGQQGELDLFYVTIDDYVEIIKQAIKSHGYDYKNPMARKWGIAHFLSDTLVLKNEKGEVSYTHFPFKYDFEDINGTQDWSKQLVTKLMSERSGQCHSMPLLYLILAEALDVQAWLSFSPSHSFIKVKDQKGNMLNYETTNGHYTSDAWVQSSGFLKTAALRNKIYMDTMSKKEVVTNCLIDLAQGYVAKFGYDKFVKQCAEIALKYDPNNVNALQTQADYNSILFSHVVRQIGQPPVEALPQYPKVYEMYLTMHRNYKNIDQLGFEAMPQAVYNDWLQSFEKIKANQPIKVIRP